MADSGLTTVQVRFTRKAPVRCSVSRHFRRSWSPPTGGGLFSCRVTVAGGCRRRGWCRGGVRRRGGGGRRRRSAHAPGRVLADLAVMFADGGGAIGDLAVLRDQPGLFGPVASTATAWRVLATVERDGAGRVEAGLGRVRGSRPGCCAARRAATLSGRCGVPAAWCRGWSSTWTPLSSYPAIHLRLAHVPEL